MFLKSCVIGVFLIAAISCGMEPNSVTELNMYKHCSTTLSKFYHLLLHVEWSVRYLQNELENNNNNTKSSWPKRRPITGKLISSWISKLNSERHKPSVISCIDLARYQSNRVNPVNFRKRHNDDTTGKLMKFASQLIKKLNKFKNRLQMNQM